jgi:ATP-dependent RNA helicase SUPV3L1/SUV3
MHYPVTALLGPTNTGKTYLAIERMLAHPTGMIGFPLRLLARENYDRVAALQGPDAVALITGEERLVPSRPHYFLCTVEAMPLERRVDFLAVDEVQLAADRERGHVFTDRILHARGRLETWLVGAETIRPLLHRLLPDAAFLTRPRLSTLRYSEPKRISRLPRRSAVIVFSVHELYEVAERIRRERGGAALVFGALSPRTRNAQVGLYQAGDVDHLVATDAIGMGLNLDIDHVVFTGLTKFDGVGPRSLTAAEVGQIAGRAGRHVRDGHFGPTAELGPFDRRLVEAVEAHRFSPLSSIYWRSDDLDFSSPRALLASLERRPPRPFLVRMRHADDHRALAFLVRDDATLALARDRESVRLLWEVCQVPDFQSVMSEAHARLLAQVFAFLRGPAARIPEDFLGARVREIDRTDGDVETLLGRIAAIRTWTYVSNRGAWVRDARAWQERTRDVEDRLSDALHDRLTQRFVDRPGTVIARYDPSELVTSVAADGEVLVQGLRAGMLEGFRFRPDRAVRDGSRGLLAAAHRALPGLVRERVQALEAEGDDAFRLGAPAEVRWREAAVARLLPGESALLPRVDVFASDSLDPALRERVRRRLAGWLEALVRSSLAPLFALRDTLPAGPARGLAFVLVEGLGSVLRPQRRRPPRAPAERGHGGAAQRLGPRPSPSPDPPPPRAPLRGAARRPNGLRSRGGALGPAGPGAALGLLPRLRLPARGPARGPRRPPRARGRDRLAPRPRRALRVSPRAPRAPRLPARRGLLRARRPRLRRERGALRAAPPGAERTLPPPPAGRRLVHPRPREGRMVSASILPARQNDPLLRETTRDGGVAPPRRPGSRRAGSSARRRAPASRPGRGRPHPCPRPRDAPRCGSGRACGQSRRPPVRAAESRSA